MAVYLIIKWKQVQTGDFKVIFKKMEHLNEKTSLNITG